MKSLRCRLVLYITCIFAGLIGARVVRATPPPTAEEPTLRVAIVAGVKSIHANAAAFSCALTPNELPASPDIPTLQNADITVTDAGISVGANFFESDHLFCAAARGTLEVNYLPITSPLEIIRTLTPPRLTATYNVPLEQYIVHVVSGEMPAAWPADALKAQAVAARSYALVQFFRHHNSTRLYDVLANVDQAFKPGFVAAPEIAAAVSATRGEIVMRGKEVLKAYYHSCCGGRTLPDSAVWGSQGDEGLVAVKDPFCSEAPNFLWETYVPRATLEHQLAAGGIVTPGVKDVTVEIGPDGDHASRVILETTGEPMPVNGNQFRQIVGTDTVRSTWITIKHKGDGWRIRGRGFGHGVGLCQWGAKGMAERGKHYDDIIHFYYPQARLGKWY